MNTEKNDIECCAFVKGYNIIRARRKGRDLASIAMDEISQALKKKAAYARGLFITVSMDM